MVSKAKKLRFLLLGRERKRRGKKRKSEPHLGCAIYNGFPK
jgi:hypothetical protein